MRNVHDDKKHEDPLHISQRRHQAALDERGRCCYGKESHKHNEGEREEKGRGLDPLTRASLVPRPQNRIQRHEQIGRNQLVVEEAEYAFRRDDGDDHQERVKTPGWSRQHDRDQDTRSKHGEGPNGVRYRNDEPDGESGHACDGDLTPRPARLGDYCFRHTMISVVGLSRNSAVRQSSTGYNTAP